MEKNVAPHWDATARPMSVFPVPGGPNNSKPTEYTFTHGEIHATRTNHTTLMAPTFGQGTQAREQIRPLHGPHDQLNHRFLRKPKPSCGHDTRAHT